MNWQQVHVVNLVQAIVIYVGVVDPDSLASAKAEFSKGPSMLSGGGTSAILETNHTGKQLVTNYAGPSS